MLLIYTPQRGRLTFRTLDCFPSLLFFYNLMSQSPNCMPDLGMSYIVILGLATENVISWHVSSVYPVLRGWQG